MALSINLGKTKDYRPEREAKYKQRWERSTILQAQKVLKWSEIRITGDEVILGRCHYVSGHIMGQSLLAIEFPRSKAGVSDEILCVVSSLRQSKQWQAKHMLVIYSHQIFSRYASLRFHPAPPVPALAISSEYSTLLLIRSSSLLNPFWYHPLSQCDKTGQW